jgi:hypothetical protein
MSLTRKYPKLLAIAGNYRPASASVAEAKSAINAHVPTLKGGLDVASFRVREDDLLNPSIDLYEILLEVQVPTTETLTLSLFQKGTPDIDLGHSFQLEADALWGRLTFDPVLTGLAKDNAYFLRCTGTSGYAQGVTVTYKIGKY